MDEGGSTFTSFIKSPLGVLIILGLVLGGLFSCAFILGAWYSCDKGEGTLTALTCSNVKIVETCEKITGELYSIPVNHSGGWLDAND